MWLLIILCAFLSTVLFHSLLCRLNGQFGAVFNFVIVGSVVGILLIVWQIYQYCFWSLHTIGAALIYGFLCELYLFLCAMVLTSISANIIVRLSDAGMNRKQIDHLYNSKQMVLNRLDRLIDVGLLNQDEDNLLLTVKGERLSKIFRLLRAFFYHS